MLLFWQLFNYLQMNGLIGLVVTRQSMLSDASVILESFFFFSFSVFYMRKFLRNKRFISQKLCFGQSKGFHSNTKFNYSENDGSPSSHSPKISTFRTGKFIKCKNLYFIRCIKKPKFTFFKKGGHKACSWTHGTQTNETQQIVRAAARV